MQQALSWGSSYVDGLFLSYTGCCCSADPRAEAHGGAKCGDLIVMTDWDTDEHQRGTVGYTGHFHDASRGLEGSPGNGGAPKTPRAAAHGASSASGSGPAGHGALESMSPLGCGVSPHDEGELPEGGSDAAAREAMALRELMKRFVQEMVHGRHLPVVIGEGQTEPCKLMLTPNLLYLQLEAAGVTHDIPLRNVKDVCPGRLTSSRLAPVELDELCNTLVLRNNECVTFRLNSLKERDEFTKCVKVLALALDQ